MRAGRTRSTIVLLRSVYATLYISVATIWDVLRGTYRREIGDARLRWWSRRLLELIDLRCRVVNPRDVRLERGRATILMSNHSSVYDIPLIFVALPGSIRMLTKKELFNVPVWGRGLRVGEFVSIDRSNREQAIRDLAAAREKMESGIVLWVAPEGTRSRDGRLGPFKKGAFMLALETGATIIPIGIRGAHDVLPPKTFNGVALRGTAEVHIGEPIDASRYTLETRERLMAEVERQILVLANIERSEPDPPPPRGDHSSIGTGGMDGVRA